MNKQSEITVTPIIKVTLATKQKYYFGSLEAIFRFLRPEVLGIDLKFLYRHDTGFKKSGIFENNKCRIERVELIRAKQNKQI